LACHAGRSGSAKTASMSVDSVALHAPAAQPKETEAVIVLVELGLLEQRYRAVMEVLDGATAVEVARRNQI
jgi:hypothetical protein